MEEKVIGLIESILKVPAGTVTVQTRAQDLEQWDSLAHVMIIGALEEQLGIEIPLEEAVEIEDVAGILKYAG